MTLQIQELEYFEVVTNSDLTEGRGVPVSLGFFLERIVAEAYSQGRGCMGMPANVKPHRGKCIADNGVLYIVGPLVRRDAPEDMAKVKQRALDKLSTLEKQALGLRGYGGGCACGAPSCDRCHP